MTISIPDLPLDIFGNICSYLNEKSILNLRQVSRSMYYQVSTLISTRNTEAYELFVKETFDQNFRGKGAEIYFDFNSRREHFIWKICFSFILGKLMTTVRKEKSNKGLVVTLLSDDVRTFLAYLKPLTLHAKNIHHVWIVGGEPLQSDILQSLADFLEGKHIKELLLGSIASRNLDLSSWLAVLQNVRIHRIAIPINTLQQEDIEVMFQFAEKVKELIVVLKEKFDSASEVVPIIQGMLSRKCNRLRFHNLTMSHEGVEQLVQLLHHMEKKVDFTASTREPVDAKLGLYKVDTWTRAGNQLELSIRNIYE